VDLLQKLTIIVFLTTINTKIVKYALYYFIMPIQTIRNQKIVIIIVHVNILIILMCI